VRNVRIIARRELGAYFGTPLAYIFVVIFVALTGAFAFFIGNFFERG
jgi:ABC-2 type transport system permease protein